MRRLEQHRLERTLGVDVVHVDASGPGLPPEVLALLDDLGACCYGSAVHGHERCTCWTPIYDREQSSVLDLDAAPTTSTTCCQDCAYRNESPERAEGLGDELVEVAGTPRSVFVCHQGMRRVVAWLHPLLGDQVIPAGDGDYRPPEVNGRAYLLDGSPAPICAGYTAHRRALLGSGHA